MNFGCFNDQTADAEITRTTVHEFGHALGAIHEQFSPNFKITWIKEVVYNYYRDTQKPPWSRAQVDLNFNNFTPATGDLAVSPWDDKSIMHYSILAAWSVEGIAVGNNWELSPLDKVWVARMYPKSG